MPGIRNWRRTSSTINQQTDKYLGRRDIDTCHYLLTKLRLNATDIRNEGSKQADGSNHCGGNRHAFRDSFCRVAHRVQVCHNLARLASILIIHIVPSHFANAISVVRNGTVRVHSDVIAGVGEHADTNHCYGI